MAYKLGDYLNSINHQKNYLMDDEQAVKEYNPYIINRCLSGFMECVLYVNELNIHSHLDKKMQYDFLINSIRPRKRFSPWLKKEKLDDLELVKSYYGYSNEKAKTALRILSSEQLENIRKHIDKGGIK